MRIWIDLGVRGVASAWVLAAGVAVSGCLGSAAANHAADVASQQHGCPRSQVRVIGPGGDWRYWLDVCGRRRLYDTRGGRYDDITGSVSSGGDDRGADRARPVVTSSARPRPTPRPATADDWTGLRTASDEFTGEVIHRIQVRPSDSDALMAIVVARGAPDVTIAIRFVGAPRYATCHATHALADDTRIVLSEPTYQAESVLEVVTVHADLDALRTIAAASSVRFRVCSDVLAFPDLPALAGELVALMAPAEPDAPAADAGVSP